MKFMWQIAIQPGNMMGDEYRLPLPRDLARFEPVTICFQHRLVMPLEIRGVWSEKSLCSTQTCPSPCRSKSNSKKVKGWKPGNMVGKYHRTI